MVRVKPVENTAVDTAQKQIVGLNTCCCIDQGNSEWSTAYEKNVYSANETIKALVNVDNGKCNSNMTEISLELMQTFTITI